MTRITRQNCCILYVSFIKKKERKKKRVQQFHFLSACSYRRFCTISLCTTNSLTHSFIFSTTSASKERFHRQNISWYWSWKDIFLSRTSRTLRGIKQVPVILEINYIQDEWYTYGLTPWASKKGILYCSLCRKLMRALDTDSKYSI